MEWLTQNWIWVVGGILVLVLIFVFTRPGQRRVSQDEQARMAAQVIAKLVDAFEHVVDDAIGQHYDRAARQKIAVGMVAVMAGEKISLEQLTNNKELFVAVMLKSIDMLTKQGEITAR